MSELVSQLNMHQLVLRINFPGTKFHKHTNLKQIAKINTY